MQNNNYQELEIGQLDTEKFPIDNLISKYPKSEPLFSKLITNINDFFKSSDDTHLTKDSFRGVGAGLGSVMVELAKQFLKSGMEQYQFFAFPGPDVIRDSNARSEHKPYHVHVKSSSCPELRINCETLEELSGKHVPKIVRKFMKQNKQIILEVVKEVYHTGVVPDSVKLKQYITRYAS
jgi:hypothetical protein